MTDLLNRPTESSRSRDGGSRDPRRGRARSRGRSTARGRARQGGVREAVRQVFRPALAPLLGRDEDLPERPLALSAGLAGLGAALIGLVGCAVVALAGWYTADAGAHGTSTGALGVGALLWLTGLGSRLDLGGVPVGIVPLTLTLLLGWTVFRTARRAGRTSAPPEDDRSVAVAGGVLAGVHLVVAVVVCVLVGSEAASPGLGRTVVGSLLVVGVPGLVGLAAGTDRLDDWVDRVPGWIRAVVATAVSTVRWVLLGGLALVVVAVALHLGDVTALLDRLRLGTGDLVAYLVLTVALLPNAVLLGVAYLLGPGFAVGTGTIVSPAAVSLGQLPAFPLLAALPASGPGPSWALATLAVPVLAALVGAARSQRAYAVTAYDSAALRGFGGGFLAALLTTVLVALAGGPMGTGRMAHIGASAGEVFVAAVTTMSLAGLLAALVTAGLQRRRATREARTARSGRSGRTGRGRPSAEPRSRRGRGSR